MGFVSTEKGEGTMKNNEQQLMDMYVKDTEDLRKQIEELKQEVELWKKRALDAEAGRSKMKRHI